MSTPSFLALKRTHEALNITMKVTTVSLLWLKEGAFDDANMASFRDATTRAEPVWRPFDLNEPTRTAAEAERQVAALGMVAVFSNFEEYLEGVEKYALANGAKMAPSGPPCPSCGRKPPPAATDGEKAQAMVARLRLNVSELDQDAVLLRFFRRVRNCIAHDRGVASAKLAKLATSSELVAAHQAWPIRKRAKAKGRTIPPLPAVTAGAVVDIRPSHVIQASAVCFRVAKAIDREVLVAISK